MVILGQGILTIDQAPICKFMNSVVSLLPLPSTPSIHSSLGGAVPAAAAEGATSYRLAPAECSG